MTNEELKKKILEIFDKAIGDWYEKDDGLFADGYTPEEGDNRFKAFIADALIAAGYRKQSEVAKEFVDRLILELIALRSEEFDGKELAINGKTYKYLVMRSKEIAAEYGVEVEK